jgi:hypothetical protein
MATKRLKRPGDPIQLGKLIVDIATGQVDDQSDDDRNEQAVERGRLGGQKGGPDRADALSVAERERIATQAARTRWAKRREPAS